MGTFTDKEREFFRMLASDTNGYFKIHCGHNRKGNFVPASALCTKKAEKYVTGIKLDDQNKMITQSTYRTKGSACMDNINTVCCLAIDVDHEFRDDNGELLEPLDVWNRFCWSCAERDLYFPSPTYIEYGHRFRLVYIFESPVCLRIRNREKRKSTVIWLNRIGQAIADMMNSVDPLYHAEAQQLTKSLRVPGSINLKYKAVYSQTQKKYVFHCLYKYYISIKKPCNGKKWDVHELSDWVLPDLPDWYDSYKSRLHKKAPYISVLKQNVHWNLKLMLKNRMNFLERLQQEGWDCGYREKMCFFYWNFALQSGMSAQEAREAACRFNKGFFTPMPEKEMLQHSLPRKTYFYRADTLMKQLDVSKELARKFGLISSDRREYDREYSRKYRMLKRIKTAAARKKAAEEKILRRNLIADTVHELRRLGKTIAEIAVSVSRSVSTVKRILAPT